VLSLAKNFPSAKSGFKEPDFTFRLIGIIAEFYLPEWQRDAAPNTSLYGSLRGIVFARLVHRHSHFGTLMALINAKCKMQNAECKMQN